MMLNRKMDARSILEDLVDRLVEGMVAVAKVPLLNRDVLRKPSTRLRYKSKRAPPKSPRAASSKARLEL